MFLLLLHPHEAYTSALETSGQNSILNTQSFQPSAPISATFAFHPIPLAIANTYFSTGYPVRPKTHLLLNLSAFRTITSVPKDRLPMVSGRHLRFQGFFPRRSTLQFRTHTPSSSSLSESVQYSCVTISSYCHFFVIHTFFLLSHLFFIVAACHAYNPSATNGAGLRSPASLPAAEDSFRVLPERLRMHDAENSAQAGAYSIFSPSPQPALFLTNPGPT